MKRARQLCRRGEARESWELLRDTASGAGYNPQWAHLMADMVGIPHDIR